MDSYELTQWMAWEVSGEDWETETLAGIQEQLQLLSYLISQANFADKDEPQGPVPKPKHVRRPFEPREEDSKPDVGPDESE